MKKIMLSCTALIAGLIIHAQTKEGRIVYERTSQMQIRIADDNPALQNMIPKERKDRFELLFGNNQSLWKPVEEDAADQGEWSGNGMQIRIMAPGSEDITYHNFGATRKVELRELAAKKYILEDSIRSMNWKLSGESKKILNYDCFKATAQRIAKRTMVNMDNGKMERKEVEDTMNITAWFTNAIPVSAGPDQYQGQLPGMILEVDVNNGRTTIKAIEISGKVDVAVIKEPKGGKKVTQDEFNKEREKMMEEMQRNNGGGRVIRMGGGS
jgi:GLPGLI family protein